MDGQQKALRIVAIGLLLMGLGGYLWPSSAEEMPVRILLKNKGGDLAFSHLIHSIKYDIPCKECHHEGGDLSRALKCGVCHPASYSPEFRVEHQKWFPEKWQCLRCHHDEDLDTPGNEYQNCMNCHEDSAPEDLVPTRTAAFHQKCMGCHEERGTGPFGEKECKKCHVR